MEAMSRVVATFALLLVVVTAGPAWAQAGRGSAQGQGPTGALKIGVTLHPVLLLDPQRDRDAARL